MFKFIHKKDNEPKRSKLPMPNLNDPWNKMWDEWANGNLEEPYNCLCSYVGDVPGEGLYGYIDNNIDEFEEILVNLKSILPDEHYRLLLDAYLEYKKDEHSCEDVVNIVEKYFYDNEDNLNQILKKYCKQKFGK